MMQAMPYNLQGKGVAEISGIIVPPKWKSLDKLQQQEEEEEEEEEEFEEELQVPQTSKRATSSIDSEPTSTLDTTRRSPSPSPPTSTSTLSSSFTGVADPTCALKEDWAPELHNLQNGSDNVTGGGIGLEDWDSMFPNGDGALLPWIMGDPADPGLDLKHLLQSGHPVEYEGNAASAGLGVEGNLGFGDNGKIGEVSSNCSSGVLDCKVLNNGLSPNNIIMGSIVDEKPQILNPQLVMNPQQAQSIGNPSFLIPPLGYCQLEQQQFQTPVKRHNPPGVVIDPNLVGKNPFIDPSGELLLRKHHQQQQQMNVQQLAMGLVPQQLQHKPMPMTVVHHQQQLQEQAVKDQLFKAADLILTGNFSLAQEILARLNHQLSLPAKPLVRAVLYVKEALQLLLNPAAQPPKTTTLLTPYDVVHKMNAYKVFSEASPVTHFVNFTSTQAILEALDDATNAIHIIDFDVACGAQWASLIQELPLRKAGAPSLKITALTPLSTTHPFELSLIRDNLVQFAHDVGVAFELQVVNLDLFDPFSSSVPNFRVSDDEAIAVSIPIWACSNRPSILPPVLRFIRQVSPKIVVSFDRGFDRCDVAFPQHLIHTLDSCTSFLESLDGLNLASDIVNKIEKFFIQPRVENTVLGRVHAPDKMPHWKTLFASAGFLPLHFSNFTETQADYVVKRYPGRGFHVEKRQASLVLSWQRRELVAASAWKC